MISIRTPQTQSQTTTRDNLESYVDSSLVVGQTTRHRHCPFCNHDVSSCGFIVTRKEKGWVLYCHRCHESRFVSRDGVSLGDIRLMLQKRSRPPRERVTEVHRHVSLPSDYTNEIPNHGMLWLWSNKVTDEEIQRYKIGYSPRLDRVILPVFDEEEIVYWQGRRLVADTSQPKYLNIKSLSRSSCYFKVETAPCKVTIVVEDILSALAVARAGYNAIALLGSHVNDELIKVLPTSQVKFWLDPDKRKESVKFAKRLRAQGITCSSILLPNKDPKEYDAKEIRHIVEGTSPSH